MVVIDTSIWVTALRQKGSFEEAHVASLVSRGQAGLVGLVLTEILRGARSREDFNRLQDRLAGCEFIESVEDTWRLAGQILLELKLRGESIPFQDAIIAAHVLQGEHEIYSTDEHFRRVEGIKIHVPV